MELLIVLIVLSSILFSREITGCLVTLFFAGVLLAIVKAALFG